MSDMKKSNAHTMTLSTMVAAAIAKKIETQMPNKSCGRSPTDHANADIPVVAFGGSWNNEFGALLLMNMGDEGSFS